MADNTLQFEWIVTIKGNLDGIYADVSDIFVAGDLLWYPVEGDNTIRVAPDVMVAFGRPKGYRGSYMQWRENNVAPQVVFEIWSPGNRISGFVHKLRFYDTYGVEEFYLYDPDINDLTGFRRVDGKLAEIPTMSGWISPRLNVRFELANDDLLMFRPDGSRFLTFVELDKQREEALKRAQEATRRAEAAEAEVARLRALLEKQSGQ
jgi:Uma2 family endonuclease